MIIKSLLSKTFLYSYYLRWKNRERHVSYGNENPQKIFYIIGQHDSLGGLWWLINKAVMHIAYAIDKGYIPVIDLQNYRTQYSRNETLGKINVWELFLYQPFGFSLADIKRSKRIVLSKKEAAPTDKYLMGQTEFYDRPDRIKYFREIFKNYIHFNEQTLQRLNSEKEKCFKAHKKVVGVLCRGTDYVLKKPKNHPVQPMPEEVVVDVKKVIKDYNCDAIFLATEDADILDLFKKEFDDSLLYLEQPRISKAIMEKGEYLAQGKKRLKAYTTPFEDGVTYLTATYILSQCACFLGGRTGGTKGVLLMSDSFEYCKIYNLGVY